MELQNYIVNTGDYLQSFKEKGLHVRKYSQLQLAIVKYHHDKNYDFDVNPWMRYCRGAVIDIKNNKVISVPPSRAYEESNLEMIMNNHSDEMKYEVLMEGTMVNVFYHKQEWRLSTRSSIGGNNLWDSKMTFKQMINDIMGDESWMDTLKQDHCYSFVLVHTKNRIVSPVNSDMLYLVEQYNTTGDVPVRVENDILEKVGTLPKISKEYISNYFGDLYFSIKGFVIKYKNESQPRIKWINPNYKYVMGLKMHNNNKFLNYIELRQKNLLKEYLRFFPEDVFEFESYRDQFNNVKQLLYDNYKDVFIKKIKTTSDVEYSLKPVIHDLHKIYRETGVKTTFKVVSDYMHTLPAKKVLYMINHL